MTTQTNIHINFSCDIPFLVISLLYQSPARPDATAYSADAETPRCPEKREKYSNENSDLRLMRGSVHRTRSLYIAPFWRTDEY